MQLALLNVSDQTARDFERVIRDLPAGTYVSVERQRWLMDAADIPLAPRGPLIAAAARHGLIEPVTRLVGGKRCHVTDESTNPKSRGSSVRVYRRTKAGHR